MINEEECINSEFWDKMYLIVKYLLLNLFPYCNNS